MVDAGGLVAMGASAPLALKVLGPTADYVGDELQQWTQQRMANLRAIFENAERKLGEEGLAEPGGVPPRVLKEILAEGSYCDDELGAEYFGGVLASSRTATFRDDRGAALAALVSRLSVYQLRTHYILYEHARRLLAGSEFVLSMDRVRNQHGRIFIPYSVWTAGMDFGPDEKTGDVLHHSLYGLMREDLLDRKYSNNSAESLGRTFNRKFPEGGIVYVITIPGIELFSKAHGLPSKSIDSAYLSATTGFDVDVTIPIPAGATKVLDLPEG